jgi:hypothetical protein
MIIKMMHGCGAGTILGNRNDHKVKGDKTVDQDQKRERCLSDITGTCTGVADGVFMTDLG